MEDSRLVDFRVRVKKMTVEQLNEYISASKIVSRALSVLGVSFILMMIAYPTIPVIAIGGFVVYVFGKTSEGISKSLVLVREQLSKFKET